LIFYVANGLMHIPLLIGWLYRSLKDELERRLYLFLAPYFIFTIFWVTVTVLLASVKDEVTSGFLQLSETFLCAFACGLLFAFYELELRSPYGISCFLSLFF